MQGKSYSFPRIMSRLLNTPLCLHPRVATVIYNALCGRFGTLPVEVAGPASLDIQANVRASRFAGDLVKSDEPGRFPSVEPFKRTPEGVAIITVDGELVNRGAWLGSESGLVSNEGVKFQLDRAMRDPKTRSIILDINSPGGEAVGAMEMASAVRNAATMKPLWAVANGVMASAAYALASGATRIIASPSAMVGSIGVVSLHMDMSRALDAAGITPTLIYAGAHKVDGNPTEPLSEGVLADLQGEVNKVYDAFIDTVAAGRGRRMSARAARATEARTYMGKDSTLVGLSDAVGSFDEALNELTRQAVRSSLKKISGIKPAAIAASTGGPPMANENDTETEAAIRSAAEQARSQALAEGRTAGQEAAAARFAAILADPRVQGHESYALKLATKAPGLTAADIGEMCADLPKPVAASLASQVAATGVNAITSGPLPAGAIAQIRDGGDWDRAIDKVNARFAQRAR